MTKKQVLLIGLMALLLLALTACVRSLEESTVEDELPTATLGEGEVAMPTSDIMQQLEMFATQTVMASLGITGTVPMAPVEGTLVPGVDQTPATGEQPEGEQTASGDQPATGEQPAGEQPTAASGTTSESQPASGGQQPAATSQPSSESQQPSGGSQPSSGGQQSSSGGLVVPTGIPTITAPSSYTLRTGEYVYCIARRFDVNPADLLALNGLGPYSVVYSGLTLQIPQSGGGFPGQRSLLNHPTTYTVVSGDTIYAIACQFGDVTPEAIAYANKLQEPYRLQAGQDLIIP